MRGSRNNSRAKQEALHQRFVAARAQFAHLPADTFTDQPHPFGFTDRASGAKLTMRDYIEYQVSGRGGPTLTAIRIISQAIEAAAARIEQAHDASA